MDNTNINGWVTVILIEKIPSMLIKYPSSETYTGVDFTPTLLLSSLSFYDGKWQTYAYVHIIRIVLHNEPLDDPSVSVSSYQLKAILASVLLLICYLGCEMSKSDEWRINNVMGSWLSKIHVETPMPRTSECDCIWRLGLLRGDWVKMRLFVWAIIQYDWRPDKKRKLGRRHQGCTHTEDREAICKLRREASGETNTADTLILGFQSSKVGENKFVV